MGVGGIESMENAFADVGHVVAVEVFEEQDIRGLSDQNSAIPEFEARRIVQAVGERDAAIGDAVVSSSGKISSLSFIASSGFQCG